MSRLHGEFRQCQTHACKHVDDNLLGHGVVDCAAEDGVAAQQAGEEGVVMALFACRGRVAQEEHGGFVDEGEEAEVARVLARRFEDGDAFGS
jgi:hypothetical protein